MFIVVWLSRGLLFIIIVAAHVVFVLGIRLGIGGYKLSEA